MAPRPENASRPPAFDMHAIASITAPSEVGKLLSEVMNEERAIDVQLDEMLQRRDSFEELLLSAVRETDEVLEVVHTDAEQLVASVNKAAVVAQNINDTVKALDTMQSNVKSALDHIHLLTDRNLCVLRIRDNMGKHKLEAAAECISQFHELESSISQPLEEYQREAVEECEKLLLEEIRKGVSSAIEADRSEEVLRLSLLFLPLGRNAEGCQALMEYLRSSTIERGRNEYQTLSKALESRSPTPGFVEKISDLFRSVALLIEEHSKTFKESFGDEALLNLILQLHKECDDYASRIIKRFLEERNVKQTAQEIQLMRKKGEGMGSASALDPRKAETALIEILGLVRRCEEFTRLLVQKMNDIRQSLPITPTQVTQLHESQISFLGRELCCLYVILEEFYVEESIKKAISINAAVAGSMITSMVDDVFFICRKSASRAITSRNVPCVCAVMSLMNTLLSKDYVTAVQRPLSVGPNVFLHAILSDQETDSQFALFLNNVQVSLSYAKKLNSELLQRIEGTFETSNEKEVTSSLLDDMGVMISILEKLMMVKGGNICEGLMTQLIPYFQEVVGMSYELDEQAFEALADSETWTHRIVAHVRHAASSLDPHLTPENLTHIVEHLLQLMVARCEAQFMQKTFNQLGGLQFDRDVRLLVTHFSEICQSSVREKFSRLTQMATILCFESVEEMLDYWGDEGGSISWRLSPAEIKSILRLRTDFSETKNLQSLTLAACRKDIFLKSALNRPQY